jgi:hypothetical protein
MYANITLRPAEVVDVQRVLARSRRSAYLFGLGDAVVAFDEASDRQDGSVEALAREISRQCRCAALAVLNHDDDVLMYHLYSNGEEIDEYNSAPGYWEWDGEDDEPGPRGGNSEVLAKALGHEDKRGDLQTALVGEYDFESDRHRSLCAMLELPLQAVGFGFSDLARGDRVGFDTSGGRLIKVGPEE